MALADEDDEETALWRRTVETLLAQGVSPIEAFEGAHLVLQAHRRNRQGERATLTPPTGVILDDGRGSGTRQRQRG